MSTIREALMANAGKLASPPTEAASPSASSPEAAAEGAVPADTHQMEQTSAVPEGASEPPKGDRDERGRFAPKPKDAPAKATTTSAPAAKAPQDGKETPEAAPAPTLKAPAAMRASVREHWSKVPAEVQAEIVRIESAHQQKMRESAEHQKVATALEETIRPYRDVLGPEPMKDIAALLQTGKALRHGDKEAVTAQIITNFGVDVGRLASILEGKEQPRRQQPEYRDPRVDDLLRQVQERDTQQRTALQQKVDAEVSAFREKAEFWDDVKEDMTLVLQKAQQRGETPTIQQVYERACMLNDDVRPLHQQRKAAEAASARAPTPARKPTTSLRNEPTTPAPAPKPKTIREHILAAQDKLATR